ncbi:MAG TPA: hypothetical protein VJY35_14130 [Candidatus Eisenbacteria bacterium]|nr:hypothetical protein [Candidatus Eisenbacteria bacterium]
MSPSDRGRALRAALLVLGLLGLAGCGSKVAPNAPNTPAPRHWRMGFSAIPPRADFASLLAALDMWRTRSDAAIMHVDPPWDTLLAGYPADSAVIKLHLGLADYFKSTGRTLVVMIDITNGLDRSAEHPALVARGRSLTEPAVQQVYRAFAVAMDTLLQPAYLGLVAETNLIRAAAPPALYAAVKQAANDAATDVRAVDPAVQLYVSVQVETAWGAFGGGGYQGIATDLVDFPFGQSLGLSSYPYLGGFAEPEDVPLDYYARVAQGTGLPPMVVEGGWTSASVGPVVSSPLKQARWIRRQIQLLDAAQAIFVFQLTFTDLDLTGVPLPPGSILPLFAALGLVDANLVPKPALSAWDSAFARPRI